MKRFVAVVAALCVIVGVVHAGDDGASVSMNVTSNSVPMYLLFRYDNTISIQIHNPYMNDQHVTVLGEKFVHFHVAGMYLSSNRTKDLF